ncbi:MAG TPA: hypothetical protein VFJ28_05000 [Marmoricola sp.]|nr:hypothetical protein [Marmoricola sp.]
MLGFGGGLGFNVATVADRHLLVSYYGSAADHAFDNPDFAYHYPRASVLSWERTVDFLGRHLPT